MSITETSYALNQEELDVLRTLTEGLRNNLQIASAVNMTEDQVIEHVDSIMAKMNARSRTDAATKAIVRGMFWRDLSRA